MFMTWVFSMSFNYWIITTWPLDYGRERAACVYIYIYMHMFLNYASSTRRCFLMATWNSMFLSTSLGKEIHGVVGSVVVQRYGNLGFCLLKEIFLWILPSASSPCFTIFGEYVRNVFSTSLPSKSKLAIWALDKSTDLLRGYCWDESGWIDFCFHDGNWKFFRKVWIYDDICI